MNGGLSKCVDCGCGICICDKVAKTLEDGFKTVTGRNVAEIGLDVFSKVRRWRRKIIKWLWPDLQRLSDALYNYWDKS